MGKMTDFLIPKEQNFLKMLMDAAENDMRGIEIFYEFMEKFPKLSKSQKKEYLSKIEEIEHRGDKIIHVINDRLNHAFITPIDKEDIHELAGLIDDIIDLLYAASKHIVLYELKKVDPTIQGLARVIKEGMKETQVLVSQLKKITYASKNGMKIHQLENEADDIYEKGMAGLFTKKQDFVEMIKLKDIYYNLELVTDKMEDVSVIIQNIVIKHG